MPTAIELDEYRREARLDGVVLDLSPTEYGLLAALMRRPGAAMSSEDLLVVLRGPGWAEDRGVLQVQVSRLRRKLGESAAHPRFIVTIHGFGYRFESTPQANPSVSEADPRGFTVSALLSLDRTIRWVSDEVTSLLGWRPDQLVGTNGLDLVHPDMLIGPAEHHALDAGEPQAGRGRLRTTSGSWQEVWAIGRPVVDSRGTVTGLLVTWQELEGTQPSVDLAPIALSPAASGLPGFRQVTLTLDARLNLMALDPSDDFLGWMPQEILGTFYSPTGLDAAAARAVVDVHLGSGLLEWSGPAPLIHRDGSALQGVVAARIEVDEGGQFAGLRVQVTY